MPKKPFVIREDYSASKGCYILRIGYPKANLHWGHAESLRSWEPEDLASAKEQLKHDSRSLDPSDEEFECAWRKFIGEGAEGEPT